MTNWSRLTVNLEPELAAIAQKRAAKDRRSFSAYVATLIERDLAQVAEAPAAFNGKPGSDRAAPGPALETAELLGHQAAAKKNTGRK